MARQLMTAIEVAKRLDVSQATFYRIRVKLMAKGLKATTIGHGTRYLESSLDRIIDTAINSDRPLV